MPIAYRTISGTKKLLYKDGHLCTTCCYPYKLAEIVNFHSHTGLNRNNKFGDCKTAINSDSVITDLSADGIAEPGKKWRIGMWGWNSVSSYWYFFIWDQLPFAWDAPTAEGTVNASGNLGLQLGALLECEVWLLGGSEPTPGWTMYGVYAEVSTDGTTWTNHP